MSENSETKQAMNVYKIDTGAIYYFAARSQEEALAVAWKGFAEYDDIESLREDEKDSPLAAELVPPDEWGAWTYHDDGHGGPSASFAELVARTTEAGVLTCSEWP